MISNLLQPEPCLSAEQIDRFFQILSEQNPTPQTELFYTNPYTLLVAVVLSAQATDQSVNQATGPLFRFIQCAQDMVTLGLEGLLPYVRSIGLYPTKAKHIMALSEILIHRFAGEVPETRKDLESLPGVGRKTANVVLNVAFGQDTIAVDTHIFRVSQRTGLAQGKTPLDIEQQLEKKIPQRWRLYAHHWLILHGRYTCKARKPLCASCVVETLCCWPEKIYKDKN